MRGRRFAALCTLLAMSAATASETPRTVIGPTNVDLADGAAALLAGDAEEGVRLTLRGLKRAAGDRDRHAAWSNLCAGYLMLGRPDDALSYCNRAIDANTGNWRAYSNRAILHIQAARYEEAEADIRRAEATNPRARKLGEVKRMLLDKTNPVVPSISVDDGRGDLPAGDEPVDDSS